MSEVTKLYENANVKKKKTYFQGFEDWFWDYPPFTAEKQLRLIKWILGKYNEVSFSRRGSGYNICIDDGSFIGYHHNDKAFERCLAGDINLLWQDLTDAEKAEIKNILEM